MVCNICTDAKIFLLRGFDNSFAVCFKPGYFFPTHFTKMTLHSDKYVTHLLLKSPFETLTCIAEA